MGSSISSQSSSTSKSSLGSLPLPERRNETSPQDATPQDTRQDTRTQESITPEKSTPETKRLENQQLETLSPLITRKEFTGVPSVLPIELSTDETMMSYEVVRFDFCDFLSHFIRLIDYNKLTSSVNLLL
jgi:hypothetical protein